MLESSCQPPLLPRLLLDLNSIRSPERMLAVVPLLLLRPPPRRASSLFNISVGLDVGEREGGTR